MMFFSDPENAFPGFSPYNIIQQSIFQTSDNMCRILQFLILPSITNLLFLVHTTQHFDIRNSIDSRNPQHAKIHRSKETSLSILTVFNIHTSAPYNRVANIQHGNIFLNCNLLQRNFLCLMKNFLQQFHLLICLNIHNVVRSSLK